jgi:hypothetical protein
VAAQQGTLSALQQQKLRGCESIAALPASLFRLLAL